MGIGSHLAAGLKPLVDLVYPPRCPLCGDALAEQGGLCAECWSALELPGEPGCNRCNRPVGNGREQCFICEAEPPRHAGIHAATLYNDASRKLILMFKHGNKIALAPLLGRLIAARLPDPVGVQPLLIPVPLHRWRLWQRGYNQAALLARELNKRCKGELLVDGLVRRKRTPSLGGLGRAERKRALSGAIVVRASRKETIKGREIVLVDDVLTSGATSSACVDALLAAGAKSVRIACFARVVDGSGMGFEAAGKGHQNITPETTKVPGAT